MLSIINVLAINQFGHEAALNSHERGLIEPSMQRLLKRHGAMGERAMAMMDPIALCIGLGMWGSRIAGLKKQPSQTQTGPTVEAGPRDTVSRATHPEPSNESSEPNPNGASDDPSEFVTSLLRSTEIG